MESAWRLLALFHQALQALRAMLDLGFQEIPKRAELRISRAAWKHLWLKGELAGTAVALGSEPT